MVNMADNIEDLNSFSDISTRNTIFYNIVKNENDFTELLCNMTKFMEFKNILANFFGIKGNIRSIKTQLIDEEYGRPDLEIEFEDGFTIIEVKVRNSNLTKNQPAGYIKILKKRTEKVKKLFFLIPRYYSHEQELKDSINKVKNSKIIEIKYWEWFFERCKDNNIYKINEIVSEYYNLLKSKFGYETVVFYKEEKNIMKESGKIMYKVGILLSILNSQLEDEFKIDSSGDFNEIGMAIKDKNNDKINYGWFGISFQLWEETGDCLIYEMSGDKHNKKYYDSFKNKFKKTYKIYKESRMYIRFDDYIRNENSDIISNKITKKLLEIINDIKNTK